MKAQLIYNKAERVRDVLRYISRFKNSIIVIHIDDSLVDSPYYSSHIRDIAYLHEVGLKVIIIPGAKNHIDSLLKNAGLSWEEKDGIRITSEKEMSIIKMASFDMSNKIMTSLAEERLTAVIGNWVKARGKGVINGVDYQTAGEIDKINIQALNSVLDDGFIPIFPCIGWSSNGKPYNISSTNLAAQVATELKAEKLFFLTQSKEISNEDFFIPDNISISPDGFVPAFNLEELDKFFELNQNLGIFSPEKKHILNLLQIARISCSLGVSRTHIVNGLFDGTLPCEIFSDLGSGTMIYKSNYGGIRSMQKEDIPAVLNLIRPFVEQGILLPRTEESLLQTYTDYIVYELDGGLKACAALHTYNDNQAEIAAVAVDSVCSHMGIGPKLINYLLQKAKENDIHSVFILTTQTSDWFEKLGFKISTVESLPQERKEKWTKERGSKVLRINF
jgi:amino-acid N-acetyltransferase